MIPDAALCGVCGAGMAPPLVHCSRCQSPHHSDCWEYNQGCSVYGCVTGAGRPLATASFAAPSESPGDLVVERGEARQLAPLEVGVSILGLEVAGAVVAAMVGLAMAGYSTLVGVLCLVSLGVLASLLPGTAEAPPSRAPAEDSLALETKAVMARIGGDTAELAHAYGLFEARHPRARLPQEAQLAVGLELGGEGYLALAAEALEKCFPGEHGGKARVAYKQLLGGHPAYWEELRMADPTLSEVAHRNVAPLLTGGARYLVAHDLGGLPRALRRPTRLPGEGPDAEPAPRTRVVGPIPGPELTGWLQQAQGALLVPVSGEDLRLPQELHEPTGLVLNAKGARFLCPAGDLAFGWEEVGAVFFETVEAQESRTEVHYEAPRRGQQVIGTRQESLRLVTEFVTVLEVHAGTPARRFRIHEARPDLFHYLGRRRQLTYEANLRLVAKDLARFAPRALPSRGLLTMLSERRIRTRRSHLTSLEEFDELVRWTLALGSPAVRAWWLGG